MERCRPVLVNGRCDVLTDHCRRSNGGAWYLTYDEWGASTLTIIGAEAKTALSRQRQRYAEKYYAWRRVEIDYLELVEGSDREAADQLAMV